MEHTLGILPASARGMSLAARAHCPRQTLVAPFIILSGAHSSAHGKCVFESNAQCHKRFLQTQCHQVRNVANAPTKGTLSLNFVPRVDTVIAFSLFSQSIRPRPYSFHSRYMCTVDMTLTRLRPTRQNVAELLSGCDGRYRKYVVIHHQTKKHKRE